MALSAFHSFCERVGRGQFPQLADRDDLWRILVTITVRKVAETVRHQTALKRGGGAVMNQSVYVGDDEIDEGMTRVLSSEPTPEAAAQLAEDYERLLDKAGGRRRSRRSRCGDSRATAARRSRQSCGTSVRTVDRKLILIRLMWQEELSP